ncbi:DUF501 domain-containing protein [Mariniblastus sp.]|jgi:uncharacterized protein|nr:DUF501 domain-containing protein [Mariniblastus sp.]MDB4755968.1 DUF501 domain-containing protein [Mariniblastus sp.]
MNRSLGEYERVSVQLGRPARGLKEVMCRRQDGTPLVIRVANVVDRRPFPTLFWLTDPEATRLVGELESNGWAADLQGKLDEEPTLIQQMTRDHQALMAQRRSYLTREEKEALIGLDCLDSFLDKGVGGVSNFSRVRCLHAWFASHLVIENTIGKLIVSELRESHPDFFESIDTVRMNAALPDAPFRESN